LIYCDLHCHSKKKNSFIYGCNTAANGGFTSWTKTRLLPRILANQTPLFNLKDCRFRIDPDKLGTARVIIWKEFGVTNSFTLENSFFGYQIGANDTQVFTPDDYRFIGESLSKSFVEYRNCLKQIEKELSVTHGWLKPKLLLEVTGIPAAQKIAEE
jgi:cytosolic carboxypeptidase protein 2/3